MDEKPSPQLKDVLENFDIRGTLDDPKMRQRIYRRDTALAADVPKNEARKVAEAFSGESAVFSLEPVKNDRPGILCEVCSSLEGKPKMLHIPARTLIPHRDGKPDQAAVRRLLEKEWVDHMAGFHPVEAIMYVDGKLPETAELLRDTLRRMLR